MTILIVDDSKDSRAIIELILTKAGFANLLMADSAAAAFRFLGINKADSQCSDVDLILMDVMMPEVNGLEALEKIKSVNFFKDVPVIMMTAERNNARLQSAFDMGAMDFISKPLNKVELVARVKSLLQLKHEIDHRKELMLELENLAMSDKLTGIANRRRFDEMMLHEWQDAIRLQQSLSLIMIDIDYFKLYNDTYGHQAGDDCLRKIAGKLHSTIKRPSDLLARYGGEEFAIIMPYTLSEGAMKIAEKLRKAIESAQIEHSKSKTGDYVTISLGVTSMIPKKDQRLEDIIKVADQALYSAKKEGRNRVISKILC